MFLAFILLIIVAFCGAQFAPTGRLHTDYCSKATTTAVNGIFVVMVFFRHLNTYLQVSAADPLQFLALSFACTVVIALLFDKITGKLDPYLFDWSRKKTNVLMKNE